MKLEQLMKKTDRVKAEAFINRFYHLNRGVYPQIFWFTSPNKFNKTVKTYITWNKTLVFKNKINNSKNIMYKNLVNQIRSMITIFNGDFNTKFNWYIPNKEGMKDILDEVFYICFFRDMVLVLEFPTLIEVDNDNLLHNEAGPCLIFNDNEQFAAFHGQEIPLSWVTKGLPEPEKLLNWSNLDQRSAGCTMLGWHKLREICKSKIIDKDNDPLWGELVDMNLSNGVKGRFLFVECGTGREFALPVPLTVTTVDEAQSILHGGIPVEILRNCVHRT